MLEDRRMKILFILSLLKHSISGDSRLPKEQVAKNLRSRVPNLNPLLASICYHLEYHFLLATVVSCTRRKYYA